MNSLCKRGHMHVYFVHYIYNIYVIKVESQIFIIINYLLSNNFFFGISACIDDLFIILLIMYT